MADIKKQQIKNSENIEPYVLEDLFEDKEFLTELYRILSPGEHISKDIDIQILKSHVIREAYKKLNIFKRNIKDTVFTRLFKEKKYVAELFSALHPGQEVSEEDIKIVTITSMLVEAIYNDLGFIVGDKLIILVEAQTIWSDNIVVRMLLYIARAYHDYITENKINIHSSTKVKLPKPELYVIYTGKEKIKKKTVSLSKDFFDGEILPVEVKVKIIRRSQKGDIINQYYNFTRVLEKETRKYGRTQEAIQETIKICKNENLLKEFFTEHEKEASDVMFTLFNEENARQLHDNDLKEQARAEGKAEGKVEGRAEGRIEGKAEGKEEEKISVIKTLMETAAWTIEQAMEMLKIPKSDYDKYRKLVAKQ